MPKETSVAVLELGRDVEQGREREASKLEGRVGHDETRASKRTLRPQDVEVERAGSPTFLAHATELTLDAEEPIEAQTDLHAELKRLRKENAVLKQERDILKKAAAFFAKDASR